MPISHEYSGVPVTLAICSDCDRSICWSELANHNISAFLVNKQDSAYKFGEIEVFVGRDDVIRAKMLIREFEEH